MKKFAAVLLGATALMSTSATLAADLVVGVSWNNFQEERWKTDEAAIKSVLEAAGVKYISTDAQSSATKQLTDIENLISQGANALIVLAQDTDAIQPAVQKALDEGIPVIGYDRLIENPNAFYITFDNKGVGKLQAAGRLQGEAQGQLRLHQGQRGRSERRLPVRRPDGSARRPPSTAATSRMSARPTPTTGIAGERPEGTWSSS